MAMDDWNPYYKRMYGLEVITLPPRPGLSERSYPSLLAFMTLSPSVRPFVDLETHYLRMRDS